MRLIYSPRYLIDLGLHVFPTRKYPLVHARLIETGVITPSNVVEPRPAGWDELALVHTPEYLAKMRDGTMSSDDVARLELARVLQARGLERIAIVDLDVHHGNGTAFIFESDPRVFTFSMHQQHNYPMWKPRGSLDVRLPDGTGDASFLRELERALPDVMAHAPQCVFYLAGADPYEDDQLGGLRLTREGLRQRDRLVIDAVRRAGVPLVVTLAGGYARRVEDTVAIHVATIEEAGSVK